MNVRLRYGCPEETWNAAKEEARAAMIEVARRGCTVSYSDLVQRIGAYQFGPQDPPFHHLLGEISTAENAAGRGMLSVLVVHKDGDKRPGPGFFKLARELGRDTSDKDAFWIEELRKVYSVWS